MAGVKYAAYNVALIPPLLFPIRHLKGRGETVLAGALAGPIAMIPGLLFYFAMVSQYPAGLSHGINERIATVFKERKLEMPRLARPLLAVGFLLTGTLLAGVGLVDLIARGYGTLTWVFLLVYVVPVLTLGVRKLATKGRDPIP